MEQPELMSHINNLDVSFDDVDESELSDDLTSEGQTSPNLVRSSIGDENMRNSPLKRNTFNTNRVSEINQIMQLEESTKNNFN